MTKYDGGPAFPESYVGADSPHEGVGNGMSLRHYFAAKAMQAMPQALTRCDNDHGGLSTRLELLHRHGTWLMKCSKVNEMKLSIEEYDYPNPMYKWVIIRLDGVVVGRCDKTDEGFVLRGKRKAVPLDKIAESMVRASLMDARARKLTAEADEERALMQLRGLKK